MSKLEAFLTILAWIFLVMHAIWLPMKIWAHRSTTPLDHAMAAYRGKRIVFRWRASLAYILVSAAWLIAVYWS